MNKKETRIGFIGLGAMGSRMVRNLMGNLFEVTVYDIRKEAMESLVAEGAQSAKNPEEVGMNSDVVILSLPSSSEVMDTVLNERGVLGGMESGGIIIDTSTIDPLTTRQLVKVAREKNVDFMDAPVSGGTIGAEKGTLSIMVGGEKEIVNACMDVLKAIGKHIYHVGEVGSGQLFKLINNMLVGINLVAISEALVLASKAGADLNQLYEAIKTSAGNSWAFENKALNMIEKNFEPGFRIWLQHKDLGLALDMASKYEVPTPLLAFAFEVFKSAKSLGLEDMDHSAVIKFVEKISNIEI